MKCDNCKKELDKRNDYYLKIKNKYFCVKCLEQYKHKYILDDFGVNNLTGTFQNYLQ